MYRGTASTARVVVLGLLAMSVAATGRATPATAAIHAVPTASRSTAPRTIYYDATNYQNNPAHTGLAPGSPLPSTMKRLWKKDFGAALSYPLVVGNRVFVTGSSVGDPEATTRVFAFDKRTGRSLWTPTLIGGQWKQASLGYSSRRLIVENSEGLLRGLSPITGRVLWSRRLFDTRVALQPLTVRAGVAYTVAGSTGDSYTATDVVAGKVRWLKKYQTGALSPAVDAKRIYFVSTCVRESDTLSGARVWSHNPLGCQGGDAGTSAVLANGRVWVRTGASPAVSDLVLNAVTGSNSRSFWSVTNPVMVRRTAFLVHYDPNPYDTTLLATDQATGRVLWSRRPIPASYGQIVGVPLATSQVIYLQMSQGWVFGYNTATGKLVWRGFTGSTDDPQSNEDSDKFTGSAIGDGVLAVQLGNRLTVFG